jgi:hypothetical protein
MGSMGRIGKNKRAAVVACALAALSPFVVQAFRPASQADLQVRTTSVTAAVPVLGGTGFPLNPIATF